MAISYPGQRLGTGWTPNVDILRYAGLIASQVVSVVILLVIVFLIVVFLLTTFLVAALLILNIA